MNQLDTFLTKDQKKIPDNKIPRLWSIGKCKNYSMYLGHNAIWGRNCVKKNGQQFGSEIKFNFGFEARTLTPNRQEKATSED